MIEGLLFFKPPFFVPRQKLNSIGAGRGGGGGTKVRLVDDWDWWEIDGGLF